MSLIICDPNCESGKYLYKSRSKTEGRSELIEELKHLVLYFNSAEEMELQGYYYKAQLNVFLNVFAFYAVFCLWVECFSEKLKTHAAKKKCFYIRKIISILYTNL